MTIQREEPDVVVATCDGCGERQLLDVVVDAEPAEVDAALAALGWRRDQPDKERFGAGFGFGDPYTVVYEHDLCTDCQSEEPAPRPRFGSGRCQLRHSGGGFDNDPCDEWPRELVFAAVGLRPSCGHPPGGESCAYCAAGYPIGQTTGQFRR